MLVLSMARRSRNPSVVPDRMRHHVYEDVIVLGMKKQCSSEANVVSYFHSLGPEVSRAVWSRYSMGVRDGNRANPYTESIFGL